MIVLTIDLSLFPNWGGFDVTYIRTTNLIPGIVVNLLN